MGIKKFTPRTPSQRYRTVSDFAEITTDKPEKGLLEPLRRSGGRNNSGHITMRRRGGGHKRMYRIIDFKRDKRGVAATVADDRVRSESLGAHRPALLRDGDKRYILAPNGLKVGDRLESGTGVEIRAGNAMPLEEVPLGSNVHNVELKIGKGGQLARSAGAFMQLMAKDGDYCLLRMPSGEVRQVHGNCYATLGQVGNIDHENVVARQGRGARAGAAGGPRCAAWR